MADAPDLFKTAPAEVTRYFQAKDSVPSFDWRDLAPQEHAYAFTVAKSAGFDVLDDIRAAVDDAIVNRVPFEVFRDQLAPTLRAKGWWGQKKVRDPKTGELMLAQLGSPRRLKTIYWANTRTAHAAGEWERIQRTKAFLPFLLYTLSRAEHRRSQHESWVGTVLPVDDPWWETHYPPNDWLCQCGARQVSRRDAEANGYVDGQAAPPDELVPWTNKRTGETQMVPRGIGPGWQTNPGKNRADNASTFLFGKVAEMPANRQRIAIEDIVGSPILKAMHAGKMPGKFYLPVAQLPEAVVTATGAGTSLVRLSADSVGHIIGEHAERGLSVDDFRAAIGVLSSGVAILGDRGSVVLIGEALGTWWRVVAKPAAQGSEWWLTSFHRKSASDAQSILRRARRKGTVIN